MDLRPTLPDKDRHHYIWYKDLYLLSRQVLLGLTLLDKPRKHALLPIEAFVSDEHKSSVKVGDVCVLVDGDLLDAGVPFNAGGDRVAAEVRN